MEKCSERGREGEIVENNLSKKVYGKHAKSIPLLIPHISSFTFIHKLKVQVVSISNSQYGISETTGEKKIILRSNTGWHNVSFKFTSYKQIKNTLNAPAMTLLFN